VYKLSLLLVTGLAHGEVAFTICSSTQAVPASHCADVTIVAEWPQGSETYAVYAPVMPQLAGMVVKDDMSFSEAMKEGSQILQRVIHHFRLLVTNVPGETVETGPIVVRYRRAGEPDSRETQLRSVRFTVVAPSRSAAMLGVSGGAAAVALGASAVVLGLRRRRRHGAAGWQPGPEDALLAKLDPVKRHRIEGDMPLFFQELENLIRQYYRVKYAIGSVENACESAPAMQNVDARALAVAKELICLSHRVRYSGYQPGAREQDRMYDFVKSLLTRPRAHRPSPDDDIRLQQETP